MEEQVIIKGETRYKDANGTFKCVKCEKFNVKKKPGNPPAKYCKPCLKKIKVENMERGRRTIKGVKTGDQVINYKEAPAPAPAHVPAANGVFGNVISPTGETVPIISQEEADFYNHRKTEILKSYDFTAAELDLLKTLLQLALEEKRLEIAALEGSNPKLTRSLINLAEAKLKVQESLGITREQRLDRTESDSFEDIIENIIKQYKEFREKNKNKFIWKCKKCGAKNVESRVNPKYKELENKAKKMDVAPVDVTPLDKREEG